MSNFKFKEGDKVRIAKGRYIKQQGSAQYGTIQDNHFFINKRWAKVKWQPGCDLGDRDSDNYPEDDLELYNPKPIKTEILNIIGLREFFYLYPNGSIDVIDKVGRKSIFQIKEL